MSNVFLAVLAAAPVFVQHPTWNDRSLLFGTPVERAGLHLQLTVGLGGGPRNEGLFSTFEAGYTFHTGLTLAALQVGMQNRGILGPDRGPDLLGGWMVELKVPLFFPELEVKAAAGLGFVLDEWHAAPILTPGFGGAYGLDLHVPFFSSSGATIGLTFFHALIPAHYFTVGVSAGYTFF